MGKTPIFALLKYCYKVSNIPDKVTNHEMEGDLPYNSSALKMNYKNNLIDRYQYHAEYSSGSNFLEETPHVL